MIGDDPTTVVASQPGRLAWAVAVLSAGLLGFELVLMRLLLVASWHHFAFLVISIALLGFGASGAVLCVLRSVLLPRHESVLVGLIIATAVSMPLCTTLAQFVAIDAKFLPALLWEQLGAWLLYWALLTVPFLLAAAAIGLALMAAGDRVAVVYGGNLLGSGVGACLGTAAMWWVSPPWLAPWMGGLTLLGAMVLRWRGCWLQWITVGAGAGSIVMTTWFWPPQVRVDPFKYGAYVDRLEQQGLATRLSHSHSPRSEIELYRSDTFHDMPFLSVGASPPPMDVLVVDGHWAGSVPRIREVSEAAVVDQTLMALPYALTGSRPRVLLLGERGGWNIWLALRHRARSIDVVQPDADLFDLLRRQFDQEQGIQLAFSQPSVRTIAMHPRHFVDHGGDRFDVIQLVAMEGSAAGSGGIAGLGQDHLITVEGIAASLERLSPGGVLFACRGIQTPARDNLKLMATFIAALRLGGVEQPQQHLLIVRDYLAVCTVAKASPWTEQQIETVRELCQTRQLTPVWFSGIREDELNHPDELPGPQGKVGDWYHEAAVELFSDRADLFIDQWPFDIRPSMDDRPFFFDFFKARSVAAMQEVYGDLWLTRVELGFLFVLVTIGVVGVVGAVLTLLPVFALRSVRACRGKWAGGVYFAAIGLGYMMMEITALSWLTRLIGDPIHAAAVTLTAFLVGSGLGSLIASSLKPGRQIATLRYAITGLVLVGLIETFGVNPLAELVGAWTLPARCVVAVIMIVPMAFLMGMPMPIGLCRLQGGTRQLVPWAWGVNGFASVLGPPVATAISMTRGFTIVGCATLALYLLAALSVSFLPQEGYDP